MNIHRLCDVVHLRFHLSQIVGLKIEQLDVVGGECVDLIGNRRQRLCGEVFRLFESGSLVIGSERREFSVHKSESKREN